MESKTDAPKRENYFKVFLSKIDNFFESITHLRLDINKNNKHESCVEFYQLQCFVEVNFELGQTFLRNRRKSKNETLDLAFPNGTNRFKDF